MKIPYQRSDDRDALASEISHEIARKIDAEILDNLFGMVNPSHKPWTALYRQKGRPFVVDKLMVEFNLTLPNAVDIMEEILIQENELSKLKSERSTDSEQYLQSMHNI